MKTTFYYAITPSKLFHLQDNCTIWLPETQPLDQTIWHPGQTIATCDLSYLFQIKEHIISKDIQPEEIIWIEIRHKTATGYIFDSNGKVTNFFRVV